MLTQDELGKKAGLSGYTISRIESDQVAPRVSTIRKIAGALSIEPEELAARPKGRAPLPLELEERRGGDEERRLTKVPEVLGEYILGRMERHEAELGAADSLHFRTATSATLWLAGVEEEASAWTEWALEQAAGIMPVPQAGSTVSNLVERFYDGLELMAFRIPLDGIKNRAEERISAMNDVPDEIASKRLRKSTSAVAESRKRFEGRRANG
jgi:transcriptional regulator with XRE-family HTH domain